MHLTRSFLAIPFFCLLGIPSVGAQNVITYQLETRATAKSFQVHMDIPHVKELTVRVHIPVWSPGGLYVRQLRCQYRRFAYANRSATASNAS